MKKKELVECIKNFDDNSDVVFVAELGDLLSLDSEGADVNTIMEVNNGEKKVIALME